MSARSKAAPERGDSLKHGRRSGSVAKAQHERKVTKLQIQPTSISDNSIRGTIDECIVPTLVERFIANLVRQTDEQK